MITGGRRLGNVGVIVLLISYNVHFDTVSGQFMITMNIYHLGTNWIKESSIMIRILNGSVMCHTKDLLRLLENYWKLDRKQKS